MPTRLCPILICSSLQEIRLRYILLTHIKRNIMEMHFTYIYIFIFLYLKQQSTYETEFKEFERRLKFNRVGFT